MNMLRVSAIVTAGRVLLSMALVSVVPAGAAAQNVGAGALTASLADTEPVSGVFNWGAVKLAPGLVVEELGVDLNVFDERDDPKRDWVFRGTPDVSVFSAVRFAKLSAYAGSEMAYYHKYKDERSIGYEYRGRLDLLISRMQPFVGVGETRSRERPNGEIDTRADRKEQELSGGFAFALGPHQLIYGAASLYRSQFFNALEEGIELSTALNHDRTMYSLGLQTALTPLATLTLYAGVGKDEFESMELRNSESRQITASLRIGAEAVVSGTVAVSYVDTKAVDPAIDPFSGLSVQAGIAYPFLEIGRLSGSFNRGQQYSFDFGEAYYIETTGLLAYTHRLFGEVDAQVRWSKSWFDYGFREGSPARQDKLETAGASLGYNLRNRTRVSLNYETARRRSPAFETRNYDRRRVFLSWMYAF